MQDLSDFVVLSDTTLTTDSRRVAKHFKKRHDNVLQAYDRMECSDEFRRLNFQVAEDTDDQGKPRRIVRMTKDGFMFLAMGFKGPDAARFKEAFIGAFNAMADQLQRLGDSLWAQRMALERRDATSFAWASFVSKCMLTRKKEKPLLDNERQLLDEKMQPPLFKLATAQ